ncbi:MAG: GntR family transcriptional regulator [bacterium]
MFLPFSVSPRASEPLYRQIMQEMRETIRLGWLGRDERLPSVRALAEGLSVSAITVKRAYEELEREGIIYRKQGLGTFVSEEAVERSHRIHCRQAEESLRHAVSEAKSAGMADREIMDLTYALVYLQEGGQE